MHSSLQSDKPPRYDEQPPLRHTGTTGPKHQNKRKKTRSKAATRGSWHPATSNRKLLGAPGIATSNKKLLGASGMATSNKKLLGASGLTTRYYLHSGQGFGPAHAGRMGVDRNWFKSAPSTLCPSPTYLCHV